MELNKDTISKHLSGVVSSLKTQFPNLNLSEEEIRTALKNPDELVDLVCSRTGMPKEKVEEKVQKVLSSLNLSGDQAKGFMAKVGSKVEGKFDQIKDKMSR